MAAKMNINFDDYKIPPNTQKGHFYYRCIPCHKNFRYKMQLIIVKSFLSFFELISIICFIASTRSSSCSSCYSIKKPKSFTKI